LKQFYFKNLKSTLLLLIYIAVSFTGFGNVIQDDTVKIKHVFNVPVIDGVPDDACWDSAKWQIIDQVWIPYGSHIDSTDFYGRYKVVWSSSTNLLYFLAETTDNIFVDGYIYKSSPVNNNYPDYDVLEIFIDENRSKGLHVFDGNCADESNPNCLGTNAENAFSYHIVAMSPNDGEVTFGKDVCDIAGSDWSNEWIPNYNTHLPEFALKKNGNQYTWEFSLKVLRDTYDPKNPSDTSMALLKAGKIMGLDMAYCDDDTPLKPTRKSFIGSTHVTEANQNNHWMSADDFGVARLEPGYLATNIAPSKLPEFNCFYSFSDNSIQISLPSGSSDIANIYVYNILGRVVYQSKHNVNSESGLISLPIQQLTPGIYLVSCVIGETRLTKKINIY